MNHNFIHGVMAATLAVLLVLLTDPFMYFMPPMAALVTLFLIVLIIGTWTGSIIREVPGDERAIMHRMQAGKVAYLSGTILLTIVVVYQGIFHHMVDTEVALVLGVMVTAKIIAQAYLDTHY